MNSSQELWQVAGWTMIYFLAAGTAVLLLGGTLRLALRHASAQFRYAVSLVLFAALALLPIGIAAKLTANQVVSSPINVVTTKNTKDTKQLLNTDVSMASRLVPSPTAQNKLTTDTTPTIATLDAPPVVHQPNFDIQTLLNQIAAYLPWLWLVGTPLTFLLLASGLIGAERLRRACRTITEGPLHQTCNELRAALGISREVTLAVCDTIASPILVGVIKPLILLPPAALTGWTTAELEMVLLHELAHVRRWDNLVNLIQRIVESLLFFHPAIWIVSGWVRSDREDCCDALVVSHTAKPQAYAELLLALASHQPLAGLATSTAMAHHPVASRIRRILKINDEPMLISRKGLTIGVSIVVVAALLAFALPATEAEETDQSTVSRESERVEDERSSEESTTKNTNDTKMEASRQRQRPENSNDLATESTEEGTDSKDLKISRVYTLGEQEAEIKSWLKAIDELSDEINVFTKDGKEMAVVTGTRKGHEKLSTMLESIRGEERLGIATESTDSEPKNSLFPTLEEQKTADFAYKVLGIELEKLNDEERELAKSHGYQGGLRVASGVGEWGNISPMRTGDILVGLHVWPTESLDQVQEILNRYDLHELSPLKFYVIRQGVAEDLGGRGGYGREPAPEEEGPHVASGRIAVNLDAWAAKEGFKRERLKSMGEGQSGGAPFEESPFAPRGKNPDKQSVYDGKTFDEWRDLWKSELNTEKRIQNVEALAAFARAGKGPEAAEAVFEVASQYDFGKVEGESVGDLKAAISQVLTNYEGIEAQYWLPLLIERLETDPKKWSSFADWVLSDAHGENINGLLKRIAQNTKLPTPTRGGAFAALALQPGIDQDGEALELVREALTNEELAIYILQKLNFHRLDLFPEQIELLFAKNTNLRSYAHHAITRRENSNQIQAKPLIVDALLRIIDDPSRKADHAQAILLLGSMYDQFDNSDEMRERKSQVAKKFGTLIARGDADLLPATLSALSNLTGTSPADLVENGIQQKGDTISEKRREVIRKAIPEAEELTKQETERGGYGGGMGGGGMF